MSAPAPRHFLDLWKIEPEILRAMIEDAKRRKQARAGWPMGRPDADAPAKDRVLAMIFEKNSTRTRFSFDAAIRQLGGQATITSSFEMQLGRGETIEDTSRVLSRMVDAVMIRANRHEDVEHFAHVASIPVINGLTDKSHPCQVMADILTFEENRGPIEGRTVTWVGDGNNVCASFIHAAAAFRFKLNIACPAHFHPDLIDLARANKAGAEISMTEDPAEAVKGSDCVVTDTWVSMGDEDSAERFDIFEPFQVDEDLMRLAKPEAVFLHCLPAHRGEEGTDEVIDGAQSLVWQEAANRIHAQKSVLAWCFGAIG